MIKIYYNTKDQKYYPSFTDTPEWEVEELRDSWVLREFPMYGGPPLSEDYFKTFHEAILKTEDIV